MRKKNDPDPDEENIHFKCPCEREDPEEVRMAFAAGGSSFFLRTLAVQRTLM